MKYITMREPIPVRLFNGDPVNDKAGKPSSLTFEAFVLARLEDPRFAVNMKATLAAVEIQSRVKDANGILALEDSHWELLRDVTSEPTGGYNGLFAHNFVPFMSAIVDADDQSPE